MILHKNIHSLVVVYIRTMSQKEKSSECNVEGGRLWGGRFTSGPALCLERLNCSLPVDKRMYLEDIQGSIGYAGALLRAGLITKEEEVLIINGLEKVLEEWENDLIKLLPGDEDIHTVNERRLKDIIGPAIGGKLHTGRSRNDQVATDMRLWLKKALHELQEHFHDLLKAIVDTAADNVEVIMPGYTHLQRAQPVRFSHWILSHAYSFKADVDRLSDLFERVDVMPLGSGAIAGNPFNIDRQSLAKALGFSKVSSNSMHAVSDRDFIAEFLFACSLSGIHLSRFAEDLIIFCSREFGLISLDDSFSTGSSLMPQKRNPDSMELVRGKSGTLFGQSCGFMMSLKGLPSTYNKDLQSDKLAMFTSFDTLKEVLEVTKGTVATLKIHSDRCKNCLNYEMLSTDLAYHLVRAGVPFRDAHKLSGEAVALAEKLEVSLEKVPIEELMKISSHFNESVLSVWNFENSVEQYAAEGGTAKSSVVQQIEELREWMSRQ